MSKDYRNFDPVNNCTVLLSFHLCCKGGGDHVRGLHCLNEINVLKVKFASLPVKGIVSRYIFLKAYNNK
jgi:hypothetical protein